MSDRAFGVLVIVVFAGACAAVRLVPLVPCAWQQVGCGLLATVGLGILVGALIDAGDPDGGDGTDW